MVDEFTEVFVGAFYNIAVECIVVGDGEAGSVDHSELFDVVIGYGAKVYNNSFFGGGYDCFCFCFF